MLVHGDDLWELGGDAENACGCLEGCHHGCGDECVGDDEHVDGCRDERDECACKPGFILEVQNQDADCDILDGDEGRLAVCAEGEGVADVVGERDQERRGLEDVGGEAQPLRGAGLEELENLRDLDDGGGSDDGEAEGFGDCEGQAFRVGRYVEVEEEGAVALGADEGDKGVVEGGGKVGG